MRLSGILLIFLSLFLFSLPNEIAAQVLNNDAAVTDSFPTLPDSIVKLIEKEEQRERNLTGFNMGSPYHTMYSHLYYLQESQYFPDTAAMTLLIKGPTEQSPQTLAIWLKQYYDGTGNYIDLEEVPKDPNYRDTLTGKQRYYPISENENIYLYRIAGKWYYSARTVNEIPALYSSVYPFGTFQWIPKWGHYNLLGLKLWKWIGILVFFLVGFLFYKITHRVIRSVLDRIFDRFFKDTFSDQILIALSRPIAFLVLVWAIQYFIPVLQFRIEISRYIILLLNVLKPIMVVWLAYEAVDIISAFFGKKAETTSSTLDDQLIPLTRKIVKAVVVIIGLMIVLQNFDIDITALIATISIGSVAIGFAAQDTIKNFFGSAMIFVDRPFQVGDLIVSDNVEGTVEEVGIRSTRVRSPENSLLYIPNGTMANAAIDNKGMRVYRRLRATLGLTYDTPPALIELYVEGLREIVRNHPRTRKDSFEIHFNEMSDSSLNILFNIFFLVPDWSTELKCRQEILLAVMKLAEKMGISFAFPTQTLHVENFPDKNSLTPKYNDDPSVHQKAVEEFITEWKKGLGET